MQLRKRYIADIPKDPDTPKKDVDEARKKLKTILAQAEELAMSPLCGSKIQLHLVIDMPDVETVRGGGSKRANQEHDDGGGSGSESEGGGDEG
jgi:hypothetical protein